MFTASGNELMSLKDGVRVHGGIVTLADGHDYVIVALLPGSKLAGGTSVCHAQGCKKCEAAKAPADDRGTA